MVTSLMDTYGKPLLKYLRLKEILVLVVCSTAFLLGIPHVMQVILIRPAAANIIHSYTCFFFFPFVALFQYIHSIAVHFIINYP